MPDSRPTRDEVATELKALRERAGYSNPQAAEAIGVPQSGLSRYENNRLLVPEKVIRDLIDLYALRTEVPTDLRDRLVDGARENLNLRRPSTVKLHRPGDAADRQEDYGLRERDSVKVTTLGMTVVPGLVQTERYMRAVVDGGGRLSPERVEVWVANRLWRQRILTESGREFVLLVSGPALLWAAGSAAVMLEQLDHLVAASRLPSVRLGVIPPATPMDVFPMHNIDLYEDRAGDRTVIVGTLGGTAILDDPVDLHAHAALLERLRELAVWGDDARAALADLRRWYETEEGR